MSWGTAKRRISSKIASGAFQKPDNTLQKGIMAAGDIAVAKIMKAEEEERLEKRRQKAAAAAEAKRLAEEQRKKEQEAKKLARQAKAVATRYNAADNPAAVSYITEQLYTFGDSAAALIESDIKSGRLSFVDEMRDRPLQGPDVPRDFATPITVGEGEDQKTYSTFKNSDTPITADDLEGISTNENNSEATRNEAGQMAEIFAPISEEPAVSLPYKGVEIDPDATETEKLDFTKIQTVADVDGALRNIKVNGINVDDKTLKELKNLRATYYARESAAWVAEASESADKAFAAMRKFEAQGDNTNYVIAKGIYTGWLNKDAPYKGLLDPEGLIGKSAQDLRDTKAVATKLGAKPEDFEVLDELLTATEIVESDAAAQSYITGASSYNRTVAQIEAALASGDYTADDPLISHLNNIARKQQKQEIEKEVGVQGAVAVDGLYIDPETKEKTFAVIMRYPDGSSKLRDGTAVDYIPLSDTEASEFAKLSVQTNKFAQELNEASAAITEGLRNAENVIQLAKADPRVRNIGGDLAQTIAGAARGTTSVLSVVGEMFEGQGEDYVLTEEALKAELSSRGVSDTILNAALSGNLTELADATAQFEAGILALVFRSGRMEGQSGNAMSNKDFERLTQMLDVKGSVEAFEATVRGYMNEKILAYDDKVSNFDSGGAIGSFISNFGWSPVKVPASFEDIVTKRAEPTLTKAYTNTTQFKSTKKPDDTAKVIPQGAIDLLKNSKDKKGFDEIKRQFEDKYGVSADNYLGGE